MLLAILPLVRDYTAMATKARLPAAERHWLRVLGRLNEVQARVFVAQKALDEGRGAVSRLARLTSMSRSTILKGMAELKAGRLRCAPKRVAFVPWVADASDLKMLTPRQASAGAAGRSQHRW